MCFHGQIPIRKPVQNQWIDRFLTKNTKTLQTRNPKAKITFALNTRIAAAANGCMSPAKIRGIKNEADYSASIGCTNFTHTKNCFGVPIGMRS